MRTRLAFIFALLALATGCSDSTGVDDGIHGTYTLETINGNRLPFVLRDDTTEKFEVMMGEITLRLDGTFTDEMGYRVTPVGGVAEPFGETLTGRFFQDQDIGSVFFEVDGGGAYDMSVGTGRLMMQVGDYELLYER